MERLGYNNLLCDFEMKLSEETMANDMKDLQHMLTIWNASSNPLALSSMQVHNLAEYLGNFLRSPDGARFLATLGYTRAAQGRQ